MSKVFMASLLLSVTFNANAANWVYITVSDTEVYFVDTSSITVGSGISKAWFKHTIFKDVVKDGRTVADSTLTYQFF